MISLHLKVGRLESVLLIQRVPLANNNTNPCQLAVVNIVDVQKKKLVYISNIDNAVQYLYHYILCLGHVKNPGLR